MKTRFIVLLLSLNLEKVFDLHSFCGALLVTEKGRLALASAKHCEGQLQTPQSVRK
jgi:type III secretory pathway component EscV